MPHRQAPGGGETSPYYYDYTKYYYYSYNMKAQQVELPRPTHLKRAIPALLCRLVPPARPLSGGRRQLQGSCMCRDLRDNKNKCWGRPARKCGAGDGRGRHFRATAIAASI